MNYVARKERSENIFFLVISIAIWNQIRIGSVPWNNELVTIHSADKWHMIVALDIGCRIDFVNVLWISWEGDESRYYL